MQAIQNFPSFNQTRFPNFRPAQSQATAQWAPNLGNGNALTFHNFMRQLFQDMGFMNNIGQGHSAGAPANSGAAQTVSAPDLNSPQAKRARAMGIDPNAVSLPSVQVPVDSANPASTIPTAAAPTAPTAAAPPAPTPATPAASTPSVANPPASAPSSTTPSATSGLSHTVWVPDLNSPQAKAARARGIDPNSISLPTIQVTVPGPDPNAPTEAQQRRMERNGGQGDAIATVPTGKFHLDQQTIANAIRNGNTISADGANR